MYAICLQKATSLVTDRWILPTPHKTIPFCGYFCFSIQQSAVSHQCPFSSAISVDAHSVRFIVMVIVVVLGVDAPVCSHLPCVYPAQNQTANRTVWGESWSLESKSCIMYT